MNTFYNIFYSNSSSQEGETDIEEGLPLLSQVKQSTSSFRRKVMWEGDDMAISIFDFLTPPHLIHAVGLVCKKWRQLSSSSFLVWKKFLPNQFVAQQKGRDYCQIYLDWLTMGWRLENEEFTSKRIVSPFGGFITTMATLADRLILGSNRGFISIIDTQKTKLLSSTRIQAGHAVQSLDAALDLLVFATIEEKYLESEEQYFKRLVNPPAVKGTLQFWHSGTLMPNKAIEFDHTVKSIKIHFFEDKMGKQAIIVVHAHCERLFVFDREGQFLDSLEYVSSFCFYDDELFVIRRENGGLLMLYYRLQPGEVPYLKEVKKRTTNFHSITMGMNAADKKIFLYSSKRFYEIDRQSWIEDGWDRLQVSQIKNIKSIVHCALGRTMALTEVEDSGGSSVFALTFFKHRVEAVWFMPSYYSHFEPLVAIADKKIYVLGSREPTQRTDETIALDCYDLTSPNYLEQLASNINWVTGKRSFCSYILNEKKWAVFGIPILMGQAALGLSLTGALGSQNLVSTKLLNTIQFAYLIASGLLMLTYPLSMHKVYQADKPASIGLLVSMMLLPAALLTPHKVNWDQARFLEMLNSFLLWRIKKIRQGRHEELVQDAHSLNAICPISRTSIKHPFKSDGIWFEKSWRLEFLEYAFMISGEKTEGLQPNQEPQRETEQVVSPSEFHLV